MIRPSRSLTFPPLVLYTLDIGLTLAGQPASYWAGDYFNAIEANPVAWLLLASHPVVFILYATAWAIIFVCMITFWRHRVARLMAFIITCGHTIGAASWLLRMGWPGILAAVLVMILAERLITRSQIFTAPVTA